jgi:hypothetical protein
LCVKGKSNHNICGIRLDCGSEVFQEYRSEQNSDFKKWKLLEIEAIWASSGHTWIKGSKSGEGGGF